MTDLKKQLSTDEKLAALTSLGYRVTYDQIWGGTPGVDRAPRENRDHITSVFIPLTAEEWCDTCMRERDHYIGPCCGNTGQMQDIINAVFRDSGWIDDGDLLTLGLNGRDHDGLEAFNDAADFESYVARWDSLDPWEKIGLAYQATKERLYWDKLDTPQIEDYEHERDDAKQFRILADGVMRLSLSDLFGGSDDERRESQRIANATARRARILTPAIRVTELLKETAPFEGYGIVNNETEEVIRNRSGYCIYSTREGAEEMLELFTRWEREERLEADDKLPEHMEERKIAGKVHIAPVIVTVEDGIQVQRT